jgi:hypothetical protein
MLGSRKGRFARKHTLYTYIQGIHLEPVGSPPVLLPWFRDLPSRRKIAELIKRVRATRIHNKVVLAPGPMVWHFDPTCIQADDGTGSGYVYDSYD